MALKIVLRILGNIKVLTPEFMHVMWSSMCHVALT